ncbi:MAG: toll/interleukin-1 receptor domain-containing protein [Nitrosomonas sp.]|uniref:toll/interleukin-1 receptor domain-containing protein n=1 Tax=Nitrosomonas sp. TaxID=42353 RepID=UPI0027308C1E|nr:toll/interleukin-1 receptor domain-containing protein [Nitrosomonas sp.]MDP1550077.1 toll/interleukin-1 receptor domain-containing protein [Nitrosomonas sp.]
MSDIFLSYAREDLVYARQLTKALEAQGWSVFWDQEIPPGKSWHDFIGKALQGARCVVVIWSKTSIHKDWVREEAEDGNKRKILVPVIIDKIEPPIGFRSIQAANLIGWNGNQNVMQYQHLISAIAGILGLPKQPPISRPHSQDSPKTLWIVGLTLVSIVIVFLSFQMNATKSLQLLPSTEEVSIGKQKSAKDHTLSNIGNLSALVPKISAEIGGTYWWTKGQTVDLKGNPYMQMHPEIKGKLVIEARGNDTYLIIGAVTLRGLGTKSRGPYHISYIEYKKDGSITSKEGTNFEIKLHGDVLTTFEKGKDYERLYEWRKAVGKGGVKDDYLDREIQRLRDHEK